MGLLSGLGGMGLGDLEGMNLYENPEKAVGVEDGALEEEKPAVKQFDESEFLFEKTYTCPACDREFKVLSVKAGKGKLKGTEKDLRPIYEQGFEPLKYDVVMCPTCGYGAIARFWINLTDTQRKNCREKIGKNFVVKKYTGNTYSYEEAFERYQMALANAIVKNSKNSERAYICLKAGWLLESQIASLTENGSGSVNQIKELEQKADEFLKSALEGLVEARRTEHLPICGMDESTLDYLIAVLFYRYDEYEKSAKLLASIITSRTANSRIKDKARELKDDILAKLRATK